jgi:hypothetical protein
MEGIDNGRRKKERKKECDLRVLSFLQVFFLSNNLWFSIGENQIPPII